MVKANGIEDDSFNIVFCFIRFCFMLGGPRLRHSWSGAVSPFPLLRSHLVEGLRRRRSLVLYLRGSISSWTLEAERTPLVCTCLCRRHAGFLGHGCSRRIAARPSFTQYRVLTNCNLLEHSFGAQRCFETLPNT